MKRSVRSGSSERLECSSLARRSHPSLCSGTGPPWAYSHDNQNFHQHISAGMKVCTKVKPKILIRKVSHLWNG